MTSTILRQKAESFGVQVTPTTTKNNLVPPLHFLSSNNVFFVNKTPFSAYTFQFICRGFLVKHFVWPDPTAEKRQCHCLRRSQAETSCGYFSVGRLQKSETAKRASRWSVFPWKRDFMNNVPSRKINLTNGKITIFQRRYASLKTIAKRSSAKSSLIRKRSQKGQSLPEKLCESFSSAYVHD